MKSIIQDVKECWVCQSTANLHLHHVFFGTARRSISDKYGFTCWLCVLHHTGNNFSVHNNRKLDLILKRACQRKFEESGHSRAEFLNIIGRNYLESDS